MRALYIVDSPHESQLPDMASLIYDDPITGEKAGGWWIRKEAPRPDTVIVCIDTTSAKHDELALTLDKYLYMGDGEEIETSTPVRQPAMSAPNLTKLKANLGVNYSQDVVKFATQDVSDMAKIIAKLDEVVNHPQWEVGLDVVIGDVYYYSPDMNLYQVIQSHRTQSDWTPPVVKALFKRFYEPSDNVLDWVQPTGAHDAYPIDAKVLYNSKTWQSTIPANVWAPGVTGWTNITPVPPTSDWGYPVVYKVNDLVVYLGSTYKCLQAHTSNVAWTPVATINVLWSLQ